RGMLEQKNRAQAQPRRDGTRLLPHEPGLASGARHRNGRTENSHGYLRRADRDEGSHPQPGKIRRYELLKTGAERTGLEIVGITQLRTGRVIGYLNNARFFLNSLL